MQKIKVGYSRLYNAGACELMGRDYVAFNFRFDKVSVEAYIGPRAKHIVMTGTIAPPEPIVKTEPRKPTRARGREFPSPELFPADLYVELIASQEAPVEDELAAAFYSKKSEARDKVLGIAENQKVLFNNALDFVAGVIGLRLNHQFIDKPIDSQCFAYRRKGEPYSFSFPFQITTLETCKLDLSEGAIPDFKKRFPLPTRNWQRASEVLAWLLRAWSTTDPVQRFVSLFIPLECVIPAIPKSELSASEWGKRRTVLIAMVKANTDKSHRASLLAMIKVSPPLNLRFTRWATKAALQGWEKDVAAFERFYEMRNGLVHRGLSGVELRVTLEPEDVRSLEDITERYVSLGLFGEANVYQSIVRP